MEKHNLVEKKEIAEALGLHKWGFVGGLLTSFVMYVTKIKQINEFYRALSDISGLENLEKSMKKLKVAYHVSEEDLAKIPKEGAFISVSNHPFGLIDGILLILIMGKARDDFRVMANFLLQKLKTIEYYFIPVDPFEGKKQTANSLKGVKLTLQTLRENHPVGIFPAGEVSTYYPNQDGIMDKDWQAAATRIIQKAQVPVVPVFFHGQNSATFHRLGKIHPLLRTSRLVWEFFNKSNTTIRISIGEPISAEKQAEFKDHIELGKFLKAETYKLAKKGL